MPTYPLSARLRTPGIALAVLAAWSCASDSPAASVVAGSGAGVPGTPAPARAGMVAPNDNAGRGTAGRNGPAPGSAGSPPQPRAAGTSGAAAAGGDAAPEAGSGGASTPAPMPKAPLFPANGATGVCPDPPLRMHFDGPPSVGSSGRIRVFDTANAAMPVATVDLAVSTINATIGGTQFKLPRPIHVDGDDVIVRLPARALTYGKTYYVTLDAGAINAPGGASRTISDPMAWRFTTAAAPSDSLADLRVALDGAGQFCSIQAALDAIPARGANATTITIGSGTYFEIIHAANKSKLTLRGDDRKHTVILGENNNNLNNGTATRALVGFDGSSELTIENLTIQNLTPQGGTQAEALRLQTCERCVVRHADILSLQDTLLWSGRIYANDVYIEGNVDFVWGTGAAFFEKSEIKTVGRSGYVVQARNDPGKYGFVFVESKITADPGVSGSVLARIDVSAYPGSQVAYIDCQIGDHIAPAGWTVTGGSAGSSLRFQEYKSTRANGSALDVSRRLAGSKQLSDAEASQLRDPTTALSGWMPPR